MDSKAAQHAFHNLVLTGKGGLVALLLILSFINAETTLVQTEPRKFLAGVLTFALTGALAGGLVAWNRGGDADMIFNAIFISTLFFFFFGVCREFSGYYKLVAGDTHDSQMRAQQVKVLKGLAIALFVVMLPMALYYVSQAKVQPSGLKFGFGGDNAKFLIELIVFTLLCGIGEYGVAVQHGEKGPLVIAESFGLYMAAHLFLQYGGFYDHVFVPVNWNKFN